MSLYSLNFVTHKTYYWIVETENEIDEYISAASPTSNEDWESEVKEPETKLAMYPSMHCTM